MFAWQNDETDRSDSRSARLGLLLGLLGYGKTPKTAFQFPALSRKKRPDYG
jgi:hypothetical protein